MRNKEAVVLCSSPPSWTALQVVVLVLALLLLSPSIQIVDSESYGGKLVEWQILTKLNLSSQILLHSHILLMVTVPWSGESRSLKKALAHAVTNQEEKFGTLKLMLLYRNSERMLADALGASEGIRILYYHHSLSYKFQGRLRVQNILSSIHYLMSLLPEELPFKSLNTPEDLKAFLESTDKAVLLLEFCGWTPRLLAKGKNNGTGNVLPVLEGFAKTGFYGETNGTLAGEGKKNQKDVESVKMSCGVDIGYSRELKSVNDSRFLEAENIRPKTGVTCSFEEFQRFDSFLWKFGTVAREFLVPPERLRFGLVTERSLLSYLGVGDSGSWFSMLYFAGCPTCSKILAEGDDLKSVLQMHGSPVTELEGGEHDLEPALPDNKPSVLLFIDRSSDSLEIRRKSKEALDAFRVLALHYNMANQTSRQTVAKPKKFTGEHYQVPKSTSGHPGLEVSLWLEQKINLKDKLSVMVMNDGKHVNVEKLASDLQGSSLHEILAYVLKDKKEMKFSSLAKDAGFQLLSDDFDVKISEASPAETAIQSNQASAETPIEGVLRGNVNLEEDEIPHVAGMYHTQNEERSKPTDTGPFQHDHEKAFVHLSTQLYVEPDHHHTNKVVVSAEDAIGKVEQETLSELQKGEQHAHFKSFRSSFFFFDGRYCLLKALTTGSKIPLMVIIDPISQLHYVLPEEVEFSLSSLCNFIDGYLNGSLLPYQRSESIILSPREAPSPPFVNLDFHEVDSIPRVTIHTFSKLVIGKQSESMNAGQAWEKDVLVLFSNSWCGFCQRMELVVREAYKAIKGYANMLKTGCKNEDSLFNGDDSKNAVLKLPLIYLMDCTMNDCTYILKSMAQREFYPSLLLFPAVKKEAVSFGGDMTVVDIIKFIADHGSNSQSLVQGNGILWTGAEGGRNQKIYKEAALAKEKYHEVLLKDRMPKTPLRYNQIKSHKLNDSRDTAPQVVVGSILSATDKLLNAHPFDESKILILKVNQSTGFQGLMINKRINWDSLKHISRDSLEGLNEVSELLKEAPLSFGGPVMKHGMPLVSLATTCTNDRHVEVLPNIYFLDHWSTFHVIEGLKLRNQSINDYWFFLGYSSWGWDQLFDEISEGAWRISSGNLEQLDWP